MPLNLPVQCPVDRSTGYEVYLVETSRTTARRGLIVFFDGVGGSYGSPPGEPSAQGRRPSVRQRSATTWRR
jgi:hypothetical protein